jgi:segregation and condensation protein A
VSAQSAPACVATGPLFLTPSDGYEHAGTEPTHPSDVADDKASPRPRGGVQLDLNGFEGPLDLLLELARRQAVDIAAISAIDLVDQFLAATEDLSRFDLPLVADWLVMAAWLVWLKSRLLLPQDTEEKRQAEEAVEVLAARLEALERIRMASEWLALKPQLGRDFFGRGFRDDPMPVQVQSSFMDLMLAVRAVLEASEPPQEPDRYRPPQLRLWTPRQAMARMRQVLAEAPAEHDLLAFVPELAANEPNLTTRRRAAIASTLIAGLELARAGEIDASQLADFASITISPLGQTTGQGSGGLGERASRSEAKGSVDASAQRNPSDCRAVERSEAGERRKRGGDQS